MMTPKNWGMEETIVNEGYCGKRMRLVVGHRCSIHRHAKKDETFYLEEGLVWFEIGDEPDALMGTWLQDGDRIRIKPDKWHRFSGVRESIIFEFSTHHEDSDSERYTSSSMIPREEFQALLRRLVSEADTGHVDVERASVIAEHLKSMGNVIGMVNGCFDLLHPGHVELLRQAKERCDILFVGMNTDKSVKQLKGDSRPFVPEAGRMVMLATNRYVDYVVPIDDPTCVGLVQAIKPDVYVKTTEHGNTGVEAKEACRLGGKVVVVEMLPEYHTSSIAGRFS